MKLYLVRHAESITNVNHLLDDNSLNHVDNNLLSKTGEQQAAELAKRLAKYKFDIIIISPLKRTGETIKPYLEKKRAKVLVSKLTSEWDVGDFAGKPTTALKEFCASHDLDRLTFKPRNGESLLEVYGRAKRFLTYIKRTFAGKSVLVVGHVNFLKCLDIAITGQDIKDFYAIERLANTEVKEYEL
jgi:broad specificity phosphatase PhoE